MQSTRTPVVLSVNVVLGLVVALYAVFGSVASASDAAPSALQGPLTIHGADVDATALIEKAVERYRETGLGLPDIEIFVHDDASKCHGHDGYWQPGSAADRIDLCAVNEYLVLHELGHAFEHHFVDDATRADFMALYPENDWRDEDAAHRAQGIERFADIVAWGLRFDAIEDTDDVLMAKIVDEKSVEFELATGIATPRLAA